MSLDKTIRENLDGNYLTIHVEDFQEGIKYAAQIKIRQIHLIGSQAKDIIVDFKELDKLSETLQVISFIQDIGNVVNFESIYNLKEMRKVYFQDKQKFTFDISDDVISTVSTANTINSYNRCYISIIRFSK